MYILAEENIYIFYIQKWLLLGARVESFLFIFYLFHIFHSQYIFPAQSRKINLIFKTSILVLWSEKNNCSYYFKTPSVGTKFVKAFR